MRTSWIASLAWLLGAAPALAQEGPAPLPPPTVRVLRAGTPQPSAPPVAPTSPLSSASPALSVQPLSAEPVSVQPTPTQATPAPSVASGGAPPGSSDDPWARGRPVETAQRVPAVVAPAQARTAPPACRRRGPIQVRDEWLLAQPRLTLPAISPDPLGCGVWEARLALNRGNDFGWTQTFAGELPGAGYRHFLVDGEHQTTDLTLRYGVSACVDVALRVPLLWRGGGFGDDLIDAFHEALAWAGFLDNNRPAFINDLHRAEGHTKDGASFSWSDQTGTGLGNVELAAHWALVGAAPGSPFTLAAIGRLTLPTATDPFEVGGVDVGLQVVGAFALRPALDLYVGVGGTWYSEEQIDGIQYEPLRGSGFVALEWRLARSWSLLVEFNAASNLVTNISQYPTFQSYVNVGAKIDLSRRWQLELGFTENISDQQSTTDFALFGALVGRF